MPAPRAASTASGQIRAVAGGGTRIIIGAVKIHRSQALLEFLVRSVSRISTGYWDGGGTPEYKQMSARIGCYAMVLER